MSEFNIPNIDIRNKKGEPLSAITVQERTSYLNKIAKHTRVASVQELITDQKKVCDFIESMIETPQNKRLFYSALFYALYNHSITDKQILHDSFQKHKDAHPPEDYIPVAVPRCALPGCRRCVLKE